MIACAVMQICHLKHLWRQVVQGPAPCVWQLKTGLNCQAKIAQLEPLAAGQENVFRLDVSMKNVLRMKSDERPQEWSNHLQKRSVLSKDLHTYQRVLLSSNCMLQMDL